MKKGGDRLLFYETAWCSPPGFSRRAHPIPISDSGCSAGFDCSFHSGGAVFGRQYFDGEPSGAGQKSFGMVCYRDVFEGKIPLKAHVHRTDGIFTAIRIARGFDLGLTLDHCTEGHLFTEEIAVSGYPAIVGPSLASRTKDEVSKSDFKTAGVLQKAGVAAALTTDHPVSRIQYLPLCAALAVREGMDEWAALRAITMDAARICRVDRRLGSLKPGKDADLAIFDGNPLELKTRLRFTIINGEIVWQN